jgi:hypothetical protein
MANRDKAPGVTLSLSSKLGGMESEPWRIGAWIFGCLEFCSLPWCWDCLSEQLKYFHATWQL